MLYGSIDFFIAKSNGASKVRVRSVLLFMILIAAMFAVCTMDFTYFKSLCLDSSTGKYSALESIKLLWKSGIDSAFVSPMNNGKSIFTGGVIGGGIAVALYTVLGKVISIMVMVLLLLSQIIVVFNISVKESAKKATNKVVKTINQARRPQRPPYQPSRVPVNRPNQARAMVPTGNPNPNMNPNAMRAQVPSVVPSQGMGPVNVAPSAANYNQSRFVNSAATSYGRKVLEEATAGKNPFSSNAFPVNPKDGFPDLSGTEFGVDANNDGSVLTYVENTVTTESSYDNSEANFDFSGNPKTHRLRNKKDETTPSFLQKEKVQDFYDLNDAVYGNGEQVSATPETTQDMYEPYDIDDEPYEITDDDPYNFEPREYQVRMPNVGVVPESNYDYSTQVPAPTPAPVVPRMPVADQVTNSQVTAVSEEQVPVASAEDSRSDITINAGSADVEGYSSTEGRIIETSKANNVVPTLEIGTTKPVVDTHANNGKVISRRMKEYKKPSTRLLAPDNAPKTNANNSQELKEKATRLEETIRSFGIETKVVNITHGPAITRFELQLLKAGTKVSRILGLQDDIALSMAAFSVRIEAPIPGTSCIGIELPNEKTSAVYLRGLIESKEFREATPLMVPLGRDIPGKPIMCNLAKMPHLLIAGSTGSGKSVCINTILTSILYNSSYEDVRMILVDPKVVELSIYNGIPHLIMPVVTEPKKAAGALKWAVQEMERRYKCFAEAGVRDLAGYNEWLKFRGEKPLPLILIVIDELADLMTVAQKDVEDQISRLAAMARAAGLHMIIATQRPSVDVITGVIKSNIPSRIAFAVSSGTDSRTILDSIGAEKLLGKGDMLYAPLSAPKPVRGQGAFLSDKEVENVVKYLKDNFGPYYDEDIIKAIDSVTEGGSGSGSAAGGDSADGSGEDELLERAVETVIDAGNASVSILQRRLGIGYPRAARLIDILEQKHYIGPFEGSKPRKVLINRTDWLEIKAKGNQ